MSAESVSVLSILGSILGLIGAFATFVLEHPRDKYADKITDIKQNRLDDVSNALGPIVSDAYHFAQTNDDRAHEDLHEDDRATIAVTNSMSPPDDIPQLETALDRFREPERIFRRCRRSYFGSYALFFVAIAGGGIAAVIDQSNFVFDYSGYVIIIGGSISIIAVIGGIILIGYFIYQNSKLDEMVDAVDFKLE